MPDRAYISSVEVKKFLKKKKKEKLIWTSFLKSVCMEGRSQEGGEPRLACDCAMKENCTHLKS